MVCRPSPPTERNSSGAVGDGGESGVEVADRIVRTLGGALSDRLDAFRKERERLNERVLEKGNIGIKRFFALDQRTYEDGALDAGTKELLGLAASAALRCDDCITYHLVRCTEEGLSDDEILEALNVALIVGGSIVIPHLRRAVDTLGEIRGKG